MDDNDRKAELITQQDELLLEEAEGEALPNWKEEVSELVHGIAPSSAALVTAMSGVALFSPLGTAAGALAALYVTHGQKKKYERLLKLVENVIEYTRLLEEEKLDDSYVGSEEHMDLLHEVFAAAAKSRDEERLRWYAQLLVGVASSEEREEYDAEEYVHVLADLTPKQVKVASTIWEQQKDFDQADLERNPPPSGIRDEWKRENSRSLIPEHFEPDLSLIFRRLQAAGLIEVIFPDQAHYVAGVPRITRQFRRMMDFIEGRSAKSQVDGKRNASDEEIALQKICEAAVDTEFSAVLFQGDLVDQIYEYELEEQEIVAAVSSLENGGWITVQRVMAGGGIASISQTNPTERAMELYGQTKYEDWVDFPFVIAKAIVVEDLRWAKEIAEFTDIPIGLVIHLLNKWERNGKMKTSKSNQGIQVFQYSSALERDAARAP